MALQGSTHWAGQVTPALLAALAKRCAVISRNAGLHQARSTLAHGPTAKAARLRFLALLADFWADALVIAGVVEPLDKSIQNDRSLGFVKP